MKLLKHYQSSLYTPVPNPYIDSSGEIDMPALGDEPTIQELAYLAEHDFTGYFRIHTMTEDAFSYWVSDHRAESLKHKEIILDALKWAQAFGFSLIVYYDENPSLSAPIFNDALAFDAFHPVIDSYGVQNWELDNHNRPVSFQIRTGGAINDYVDVSADRCTVITWDRSTSDWRGPSALLPAIEDIRDFWHWRRRLGYRAGDRAPTRLLINKQKSGWTPDEADSVDTAFANVPHARTRDVEVSRVTGDLDPAELQHVLDSLRSSIASSFAVSVADLRGAEAGQKLSVDSNDTRYARSLHHLQEWAKPHVNDIFNKMGWSFTGFNPPWEVREDLKDKMLLALVDAMEKTRDKDVYEFLKGKFMSEVRDVRRRHIKALDRPEAGFSGNGKNVDGNEENHGPGDSERARDQSGTNRARKENDRFPA
jgi:hypothetical protein